MVAYAIGAYEIGPRKAITTYLRVEVPIYDYPLGTCNGADFLVRSTVEVFFVFVIASQLRGTAAE